MEGYGKVSAMEEAWRRAREDDAVRAAASAFLKAGKAEVKRMMSGAMNRPQRPASHPDFVALHVTPEGFSLTPGVAMAAAGEPKILRVHVLDGGLAAEVQVQWDAHAGFLTLLQHAGRWVVIAAVTAPATSTRVTPADFGSVAAACWDEYGGANRACDADRMAKVFHPQCRLTYTGGDGDVIEGLLEPGDVVIKSQDEFLAMVRDRYSTPMHAPYAHLRDDPRAAAGDTLLSITFATPDLAMVVLKVGHPPCLWTDLLTCARFGGQWWIVAKSSCKEPLLEEEARNVDGSAMDPWEAHHHAKYAKVDAVPSNQF